MEANILRFSWILDFATFFIKTISFSFRFTIMNTEHIVFGECVMVGVIQLLWIFRRLKKKKNDGKNWNQVGEKRKEERKERQERKEKRLNETNEKDEISSRHIPVRVHIRSCCSLVLTEWERERELEKLLLVFLNILLFFRSLTVFVSNEIPPVDSFLPNHLNGSIWQLPFSLFGI